MGLEINLKKKTKFMIISRKPHNENERVKFGTYDFEIVKDCRGGFKALCYKLAGRRFNS